jgi:nitrate reductase gamma subunit
VPKSSQDRNGASGFQVSLVFPLTRLAHIWSAPVWYLGRGGKIASAT